ncbi:MAG: hypothetical protein ABIG46_00155 [Candidatus Omnitrophota bacterium]|nr:hypothetical protein [Candidatus Omnitrophota bacterium]
MSNLNHRSHPGMAAVLSFIFNGLGQLYNGEISKGLFIIFLSSISMFILVLGSVFLGAWMMGKILLNRQFIIGLTLFSSGILLICALGIYSIIDAYKKAAHK